MIIRVIKRDHPYVMIDKTALEDPRLSFRAKGLHAYLLAKPDNWTPNREQLASASKEGRDAVEIALRELKMCGYFERKRERCADGTFRFIGVVYEICQSTTDGKSGSGEPGSGEPGTDFPSVISKEERVKNKEQPSASKPRFSNDWYKQNVDDYQEIKGVTLNGPEFGEIQRTLKTIYQAGHMPEDICALMKAFEASKEEWTDNWTLHTVARKLPEFKAGKLFGNSRELPPDPKTTALEEDIYQADRAIIAIQRKLDAYALTEDGTRRHKPRELTINEEEKRAQLRDTLTKKEEERARLVREIGKRR